MATSGGSEKHSVSMSSSLSEEVRERVGARGFSAYVAKAVARQLQRDALDEAIERMEAKHGPADEDRIATIMDRLAE